MKKSRFSEEQIARVLAEAAKGERTVRQGCKDHGVTEHTLYIWRRKYGGMQTDDIRHLKRHSRNGPHPCGPERYGAERIRAQRINDNEKR